MSAVEYQRCDERQNAALQICSQALWRAWLTQLFRDQTFHAHEINLGMNAIEGTASLNRYYNFKFCDATRRLGVAIYRYYT